MPMTSWQRLNAKHQHLQSRQLVGSLGVTSPPLNESIQSLYVPRGIVYYLLVIGELRRAE